MIVRWIISYLSVQRRCFIRRLLLNSGHQRTTCNQPISFPSICRNTVSISGCTNNTCFYTRFKKLFHFAHWTLLRKQYRAIPLWPTNSLIKSVLIVKINISSILRLEEVFYFEWIRIKLTKFYKLNLRLEISFSFVKQVSKNKKPEAKTRKETKKLGWLWGEPCWVAAAR